MRNKVIRTVLVLSVLVATTAVLFLAARNSRGQTSSHRQPQAPVKPILKPISEVSGTTTHTSSSSTFLDAAERNGVLRNDLAWIFGGKQQRGWYLYELLIRDTLQTESDSISADFAEALASWQKRSGLTATGALDEDSLMSMVSQWQNNRLKNRAAADPSQLLIAPVTDFYDPARLDELRQVERNTYAAYHEMLKAAIADPTLKLAHVNNQQLAPEEKYFKIISSYRSREYQEELRRKSPNAGSAGLAINSPHFTGRALDIYVGGDPVDTRDSNRAIQINTPVYKWLVRNAERFGFRPYFYEPWHWEYVKN